MEKLTVAEQKLFKRLNTPEKIQDFLNRIPINFEKDGETCRSPRETIKTNTAHCMEGALLAAAILASHGHQPLLLDLKVFSIKYDSDHVVALFKERGYWGAISKTNHAVLRYREPVYKTVRELAMSYFHEYFLDTGKKTLHSYSKPFNLNRFKKKDWITDPTDLWYIVDTLDESPHIEIVQKSLVKKLRKADPIEIKAGKLVEWKRKK